MQWFSQTDISFFSLSSIVNLPGESTLRREFLRLQQENKSRSDPQRQQALLKDQEKYKKQLSEERQKRIVEQQLQRKKLEDVGFGFGLHFIVLQKNISPRGKEAIFFVVQTAVA